jgi:hypothetical protein
MSSQSCSRILSQPSCWTRSAFRKAIALWQLEAGLVQECSEMSTHASAITVSEPPLRLHPSGSEAATHGRPSLDRPAASDKC